MKGKIFGSIHYTAGRNLAIEVKECQNAYDVPIGIPEYNYSKALEIAKKALTPKEFDLICRGFGFNRPRQQNKEIAEELKTTPESVTAMAARAMAKLQASPYKAQLCALIPTPNELIDTVMRLQREAVSSKELKATRHRLETAENKLLEANKAKHQLEQQNQALSYERDQLTRKLRVAEASLAENNTRIARFSSELDQSKALAEAARAGYTESISELMNLFTEGVNEVTEKYAAKIGAVKVRNGLETLGLDPQILAKLKRVGITTIDELVREDKRSLSRLRFSAKELAEIEVKLKERGLKLRAS